MSEIKVRLHKKSPNWEPLPALDDSQQAVVREARAHHVIVRGAPSSGRSTCALAVFADAARHGETALLMAPDRSRVDTLVERAQELAPALVRPVRTPASFAYQIVSTWRTQRSHPLEGVELVTGAAQEQLIMEALEEVDAPWPQDIPPDMRQIRAFRAELRNLFARAGEAGIDGEKLTHAGEYFGRPEWVGAAPILSYVMEGETREANYPKVLRVDLSRIQHLAASLIDVWEKDADSQGVEVPCPVPDVIVVDDLQDCTPSTLELLNACRRVGARIVAFSNPDVTVAGYRGGEPHLDLRLAHMLDIAVMELGEVHRQSRLVREVVRAASDRISQSGSPRRRTLHVADDAPEGEVVTHLGATPSQMGALLARALRSHHLHGGVEWKDQVVIVRSSSLVEEVRRYLQRGGVPVTGGERAFDFAAQPTTRLLLELVTLPRGEGDTERNKQREVVTRLLSSPLVGADSLSLHRLLRRLEADEDTAQMRQEARHPLSMVDLVTSPDLWRGLVKNAAGKRGHMSALADPLEKAVRMWEAGKEHQRRPQEGLWALWDASKVAEKWREGAINSGGESSWYDDQLDALCGLQRVADVWEQRNPGGNVYDFATQLLEGGIPLDTITEVGVRPAGVQVLTPVQAMGRHWDVVMIAGLQDGAWPNMRLRDRILRADLLADVGAGRTSTDAVGREILEDSVQAARKGVLDDEYRLFTAAASRARNIIHVGAVRNEDAAPSAFFDLVARIGQVERVDDSVPLDQVPAPLSLSGHIADLRARAASPQEGPDKELAVRLLALLAREGIVQADPQRWMGAGGIPSSEEEIGGDIVLSPSQFERALQCPLKWFLTTIGAEGAGTSAQSLGTLVHDLAEHQPHGSSAELAKALDNQLPELELNLDTWAGRIQEQKARNVVENLATYVEQVTGRVEVEKSVDAHVEGVHIRGRVDRLEHVDEGVRITDLKTGKSGYSKEGVQENAQLAAYQLALIEQGIAVAGARIALLGDKKPKTFEQSALEGERLEEWRHAVREVGKVARGPHFEATPSDEACRYCSFQRLCPAKDRGRKVIE